MMAWVKEQPLRHPKAGWVFSKSDKFRVASMFYGL
jgi:hypothetical protein